MKQVCEYCRSHMDIGRAECRNCGAPMQQFHPAYNTCGSAHFVQDCRSYHEIIRDQFNHDPQMLALLQSAYNSQSDWIARQIGNYQSSATNLGMAGLQSRLLR